MKNIFTLIFVFSLVYTDLSSYTLTGKIIDFVDKKSLSGAIIFIENTNFGAFSKSNGYFEIKNIPEGKYIIFVRYLGYKTEKSIVELKQDSYLEFELKQDLIKKDAITVTANKKIQNVQDVPISTSTIDGKSINDMGLTKLDEAIVNIPGVELNRDNISIRGSSGFSMGVGSRVALLIDGFPLLSGDTGDMKFDALPISITDRVEVIKGAGSALYGSSALGGVINLITLNPSDNLVFNLRLKSGYYTPARFAQWNYTNNLRLNSNISFDLAKSWEKTGFISNFSYNADDSYRKYDKSNRWSFFTKFNYNFSDDLKLSITSNNASETKDEWVYWNSLDSATIPPTNTNQDINYISSKYNLFGNLQYFIDPDNVLILKIGSYFTHYKNSYNETSSEFRQSDAIQSLIDLQGNSKIQNNLVLTYGFNFVNSNVDSKNYGLNNQKVIASYIQSEFSGINSLILTLGIRLDKEILDLATSDIEISPKFGLNYELTENLHLRASIGNGFRSPSIGERYSTIGYQGFKVVPNNNLKSEKNLSFEIGSVYDFELANIPFKIDFALFENHLTNLIEPSFSPSGRPEIQFQNITKANITGLELNIKTFLFNLIGMDLAFTYMNPIDESKNEILKYRSKYLFYSKFYIPVNDFEIQAEYRYKSKTENIDKQLGLAIRDYDVAIESHVIDCRLIWNFKAFSFTKNQLILNINNLLDYYYLEVVGNLARTRLISLQYNMQL